MFIRIRGAIVLAFVLFSVSIPALAQVENGAGDPGANVNLIGLTPDPADIRDLTLRQQNEPACAIRPGDSACIICGYNDYRTIDSFNDAWQGISMSCDAGNNWLSRIAPGHPDHAAPIDAAFAADPRIAAIPGMAIFNFIAGYRDSDRGVLAIQHWLEINKEDADYYEPGLETSIADAGSEGRFLDKPDLVAVLDAPTSQSTISLSTAMENPELGTITRDFPTGKLYVAYAAFTGSKSVKVFVKVSTDWGRSWRNQAVKLSEDQNLVSGISLTAIGDQVLAVWRRAGDNNDPDSIMYSIISEGGTKATKGEVLANICSFDQVSLDGTYGRVSFRTNDFPWTANDGKNFYVFYSDRAFGGNGSCDKGRPRIVMHHSSDGGLTWNAQPVPVDATAPVNSFQFMPTAVGANGSVQVAWYDTRRELDANGDLPADLAGFVFGETGDDPSMVADYTSLTSLNVHRKVDVYTSRITADTSGSLSFAQPERVSQFRIAAELTDESGNELDGAFEAEASFANKKLFGSGTLPFLGDYISVAAQQYRKRSDGKWEGNASISGEKQDFFVAWADNRDVRGELPNLPIEQQGPLQFDPAGSNAALVGKAESEANPAELLAADAEPRTGPPRDTTKTAEGMEGGDLVTGVCVPGTTQGEPYGSFDRSRDSNIYGSLVKDRVRLFAPTPAKPLTGLQRAFVIALTNSEPASDPSDPGITYKLEIANQPCTSDGVCRASFRQQPSHPDFRATIDGTAMYVPPTLTEFVTVPPQGTFARTVFVVSPLEAYQVKVQAYECSGAPLTCDGTPVSTVLLTGSGAMGMSNPDFCPSGNCNVLTAEYHNPVLTLLNPTLINPTLINPTLINMAVQAGYAGDVYDAANPTLINPALINFILQNPALINPTLINPTLINSLIEAVYSAATAAGYSGDKFDLDNPTLINPALINYALDNPTLINPTLINYQLANPTLINAALETPALINPALINPALINPALINPTLINPALINPTLINPTLINPTLINAALAAGYTGDIYDLDNPTLINPALINFAIANPTLINPALINPALINPTLINPALINYTLSNPALINPALINPTLINPTLINPALINPTLINPSLINSTLDGDPSGTPEAGLTYDDYTYVVTNTGNVTTALDADISINKNGQAVDTQMIAWTANITPTVLDCEERLQMEAQVLAAVNNPDTILEKATIDDPFAGEVSAVATPGQTVFFTLRVFGTPAELANVAVSGFTAASQAANCDVNDPAKPAGEQYYCQPSLADERERIAIEDILPPNLVGLPGDQVLEATSSAGASYVFSVSATDNVDANPVVLCNGETGPDFNIEFGFGETTVTCSATDSALNGTSASFTVNVQDTTAPEFILNDGAASTEAGSPYADPGYSVTDSVSGADGITVTVSYTSGGVVVDSVSELPWGAEYTVIYTVVDAAGNSTTFTRTMSIVDTIAPVISLLGETPVTIEAGTVYEDAGATVMDNTPAPLVVSVTGPSGYTGSVVDTGVVGTYTVHYTATDAGLNTALEVTRTVIVEDNTPPVIPPGTFPPTFIPALDTAVLNPGEDTFTLEWPVAAQDLQNGLTITCDVGDVAGPISATSTSYVGGTLTATFSYGFPVGTTSVTCTVTDQGGNFVTSAPFPVLIEDRPIIDPASVPDAPRVEANSPTGYSGLIANLWEITATDRIDGLVNPDPIVAVCTPAQDLAFGDTTISCTATDSAGNLSDPVTFVATVEDTTAPAITTTQADIVVEANAASGYVHLSPALSLWAPVYAEDAVDGPAVEAVCTPAADSDFVLNAGPLPTVHTVICIARDEAGNPKDSAGNPLKPGDPGFPATAATTFTVTVQDTKAPVIGGLGTSALPQSMSLEATGAAGFVTISALWTDPVVNAALDTVDGLVGVTCAGVSTDGPLGPMSTFPLGLTQIFCTATDSRGNSTPTAKAFTVTVGDHTLPSVTITFGTAGSEVEATSAAGASVVFYANASDTVSGPLPVSCSKNRNEDSSATFPLGSTVLTCTATDAAGNQGSATATVKVRDTTAPTISATPLVVNAIGTSASVTNAMLLAQVTATDAVGVTAIACPQPSDPTVYSLGIRDITCTATDGAGNIGTTPLKLTVQFKYDIHVAAINGNNRAGSGIPLDWNYTDPTLGNALVDSSAFNVSAVWYGPYPSQDCSGANPGTGNGTAALDAGSSDFRYSRSKSTWQFSWKTPTLPGSYLLTVRPQKTPEIADCVYLR